MGELASHSSKPPSFIFHLPDDEGQRRPGLPLAHKYGGSRPPIVTPAYDSRTTAGTHLAAIANFLLLSRPKVGRTRQT
jgi:hypothetical protein